MKPPRDLRDCPIEDADADYRAAWGQRGKRPYGVPMRAAFYEYLPDAPVSRFLGRDDAARYLSEITRVIEMQCWSRSERERLRVLHHKWQRRAEGKDARYSVLGTEGGVNDRYRRKTAADIICAIQDAISASAGRPATRPGVQYRQDPAWPFGKPTRT